MVIMDVDGISSVMNDEQRYHKSFKWPRMKKMSRFLTFKNYYFL